MAVTITHVAPGSIAEALGLEAGDAVESIAGEPIIDQVDYQALTARKKEVSIGFSILMMAFMAFSAIAFLIEVQYRYVYFVFPAICVAAAILADLLKEAKTNKS